MKKLDVLVLVYAIILLALAIESYLVKKHIPSFAGGTLFGVLEIFFLALTKTNPRIGRIGSAVVALVVLGMFTGIIISKGPNWSNLTLAISSLVVVVSLVGGHFLAQRSKAS